MALTVTDMLNSMNEAGLFSYVIPFMLIFAVVFAILEKTGILGKATIVEDANKNKVAVGGGNKVVSAVIAAAIGLLSLQFDVVPIFFANIFPKFGVGLSVFLVVLIFLGMFYNPIERDGKNPLRYVGWIVAIVVVIWGLSNWNNWFSYGFSPWFVEYLWALIVLVIIIGVIALIVWKSGD